MVEARADKLFDTAAASSGCATPLIALNELAGANLPTPWTPTTAQYRANVLALVQRLAERGARPFLLLPKRPYTHDEAADDWWRQAAQVADLVPEVYFSGPSVSKQGAVARQPPPARRDADAHGGPDPDRRSRRAGSG